MNVAEISQIAPSLVGRTISGVVLARGSREPNDQVFLLFTDGTHYEFFGHVDGSGHIYVGDLDQVMGTCANEVVFVTPENLVQP